MFVYVLFLIYEFVFCVSLGNLHSFHLTIGCGSFHGNQHYMDIIIICNDFLTLYCLYLLLFNWPPSNRPNSFLPMIFGVAKNCSECTQTHILMCINCCWIKDFILCHGIKSLYSLVMEYLCARGILHEQMELLLRYQVFFLKSL